MTTDFTILITLTDQSEYTESASNFPAAMLRARRAIQDGYEIPYHEPRGCSIIPPHRIARVDVTEKVNV